MLKSQFCTAVILTALPITYRAVRSHLNEVREEIHPLGTVYERGSFAAGGQIWDIGIVEVGIGNANAALEAERAISYFKPDLILFVGVADGLKDVRIGDVVAATKVYGYESGKAQNTFQIRPDISNSTYRIVQRARAEARKDNWLRRVRGPLPDLTPHVFVAPIAAGEKVISSTHSAIWRFLKTNYSDALAVEMEGSDFLRAVHANQQVDALIIRGISDLIDDKSEVEANNSHEKAAQHASAFAFELVAKLDPTEILPLKQPAATTPIPYSSGRSTPIENIGEPANQMEKVKRKQNERIQSSARHYLYDVALSVAKEDRDYADALANILQLHGIKVFYDKYNKSNLWGKNLYTHLSDIYQNKAQYCVMFLSKHYANTLWTNHERDAAQARAFREKQEYILPVRLDDTHFPGILLTTAYLSCPPETIDAIANIIIKKLAGH